MGALGNGPDWNAAFSKSAAGRITRVRQGGETVWLKDFSHPSPPKWHNLQRVASYLTRLELLRPVPTQDGIAGAQAEVEAIRRFREAGVRVPQVLWAERARVVLCDLGPTLRTIERSGGEASVSSPIAAAAQELRRIHAANLVHGRPILRNMTWDGATVGFIDFEERPVDVMPRDAARARDILLLLMSVGRRNGQELTRSAFAGYAAEMPPGVGKELQRVVRAVRPLTGILRSLGGRNRDAAGLVRALAALESGL